MNQGMKDNIARGLHTVIKRAIERGGPIDPIDLSERLLDTVELLVDMAQEESGIASLPEDLRASEPKTAQATEPAWDFRANAPAADPDENRPHFLAPPSPKQSITPLKVDPKAKSLLVMPGDPEFSKPADTPLKPGVIKASMRKAITRPASNSPAKQYWTEADIIEALNANTPEEIPFDIQRADGTPFHIVAKRNVINRQGLGGVVLTYKDPRVGDGGNIELLAQAPFSLYDESLDIEAGLKSIVAQLAGKYRDRSAGTADPVAVGAPPNLGDYMRIGMAGGNVDVHIDRDDSGRAIKIDSPLYADRNQDVILQRALESARRANAGLVPPESRLK
jgi:hypothetical protein